MLSWFQLTHFLRTHCSTLASLSPDGLSRHTYLSAIKVRRPEHLGCANLEDQDCRGLLVPALTLPSQYSV